MKEEIKRNLLIVNSRDKKSGTNSDFIYSLGDNSLEIEAVSLKSVSIPHTYTNINSTNNILKYETGTEFVLVSQYECTLSINNIFTKFVMPAGVYTQNEFLENLNAVLFGNLIVSYNDVASRYEVTTQYNVDEIELAQYQYTSFPNLWTFLGFVVPTTLATTPNITLQAPNAPTSPFDVIPVQYYEEAIPEGQYTATELLPLIATALSLNLTGAINVTLPTVPPDENKVHITGATITWKFSENDIAHYLGFNWETMSYSLNQVAQHKPDLLGYRYLYVASNTLMNGYNCIQKKGEKTSIVGAIPICSTYGSKDTWEAHYPVIKAYDGAVNISELDIQILTSNNDPVPLDGADVLLVFEVWATVRL